ncbi:hypothetical protein HAX54_011442 [Datura stramonium]|uniref:Uncharacterized protein n=1 Tax=Datura stramonium TaxID=4076 RepID=A0ABS8Y4W2_DATST|nr:hypothetical protein [Datura stramonium]
MRAPPNKVSLNFLSKTDTISYLVISFPLIAMAPHLACMVVEHIFENLVLSKVRVPMGVLPARLSAYFGIVGSHCVPLAQEWHCYAGFQIRFHYLHMCLS